MAKNSSKEKQTEKTNVMRLLEQAKVPYEQYSYVELGVISGQEVAKALGQDPNHVFKTLVTVGKTGEHYVFVIPVICELNLKKAAKAVGAKAIEMVKSKELLGLTGYIHGGCSMIGMKKRFTTVIHESAKNLDTIIFSAGKVGYQVEVSPENVKKLIPYTFADVTD